MASLFAYLDLGAGSMLLQMVLAGLLGLGYTLKTYWRRIVGYLRPQKGDEDLSAEESQASKDGS